MSVFLLVFSAVVAVRVFLGGAQVVTRLQQFSAPGCVPLPALPLKVRGPSPRGCVFAHKQVLVQVGFPRH